MISTKSPSLHVRLARTALFASALAACSDGPGPAGSDGGGPIVAEGPGRVELVDKMNYAFHSGLAPAATPVQPSSDITGHGGGCGAT